MATSHRDGMAIRSVSAATTNDSHYSAVQFTADYDPMTSYPSHLLLPASLPPEKKVDTSEDCGIGSRQTELGTSRYVGGPSTDSLIPSSTASDVTNYALNDVTLLRHSSQFSLFRATKPPPDDQQLRSPDNCVVFYVIYGHADFIVRVHIFSKMSHYRNYYRTNSHENQLAKFLTLPDFRGF